MFSQISHISNLVGKFWVKRCCLSASVYYILFSKFYIGSHHSTADWGMAYDHLRFINNCALAGGPSPKLLVPVQEYHPASDRVTDVFTKVVVKHPLQLSPGMSLPLNCHLCVWVGGFPIVLQVNLAVSPSSRVRFLGRSAEDWATGRSEGKNMQPTFSTHWFGAERRMVNSEKKEQHQHPNKLYLFFPLLTANNTLYLHNINFIVDPKCHTLYKPIHNYLLSLQTVQINWTSNLTVLNTMQVIGQPEINMTTVW